MKIRESKDDTIAFAVITFVMLVTMMFIQPAITMYDAANRDDCYNRAPDGYLVCGAGFDGKVEFERMDDAG